MGKRDNKAATGEFLKLVGMGFDEFTREAPVKQLLALAEFAGPIDITVLRLADEAHPLFQQQRDKLAHALRHAWQAKETDTAERRRQMTDVVRRLRGGEGGGRAETE